MKNIGLKIIVLSAAAVLALCFSGCGKSNDNDAEGTDDTSNAEPVGTVEPADTQAPVTLPEIRTDDFSPNPRDTEAVEETRPQQTDNKIETELTPITTPSAGLNPVIPPVETASAAADTALAQVGKEFKLGGESPEQGFDNSGLVYYALTQNGISCPRTAKEMSAMGEKKTLDSLKAGDIAFFNMDDEAQTLFVALYVGEGKIVISTDEDQPVKIADINSVWYSKAFAYGISPEG